MGMSPLMAWRGMADVDTAAYGQAVREAVGRALAEDLGPEGDLTAALVPEDVRAQFALRARRSGVLAGRDCATEAFLAIDPAIDLRWRSSDGDELKAGDTVLELAGLLRPILTAERTALNFLGRLSGIATLTAQFVMAAHESNPSVAVLDTRKTTPGLRLLEKAAVRAGGGTSHRFGLSDAVLVKDNHLAGTSITDAVRRARALWPGRMVEIECDALDQVAQAARAGADTVLLDNMDPGMVVEAIAVAHMDAEGDVGQHRRLRGGGAGPDFGRGADPFGPGARPRAGPALDHGGHGRRQRGRRLRRAPGH
jgi:nicotinate-nucleotide pyrophosphorylase (carboxylating)